MGCTNDIKHPTLRKTILEKRRLHLQMEILKLTDQINIINCELEELKDA